jgi:hypothetical protein
MHHEQAFK